MHITSYSISIALRTIIILPVLVYTNTGTIIIGWLAFYLRSLRFPLVSLNYSHPHNSNRHSYITTSVDYINSRLDSDTVPPSSMRRSVRLTATPSSDHCYSHTSHHSEWTASDLTGRFPVPSYLGHEYILVTLHRGFIHSTP